MLFLDYVGQQQLWIWNRSLWHFTKSLLWRTLPFLLPYICPLPLLPKSLLFFTQSSVSEGIFHNSRCFHNDVSCLHAQWFLHRSLMYEKHISFYKTCLGCAAKGELIRLLTGRGIQKLQIQCQLKTTANQKLVVKLNFVLPCHKAVALRNTQNIGTLAELTVETLS